MTYRITAIALAGLINCHLALAQAPSKESPVIPVIFDSLACYRSVHYQTERVSVDNRFADPLSPDLVLHGEIVFNNCEIVSGPAFYATTFTRPCSFRRSWFDDGATFNIAKMNRVDFSGSHFLGDADFAGAKFTDTATFSDIIFDRKAFFGARQAWAHGIYVNILYERQAIFKRNHFLTDAFFDGTICQGLFDFSSNRCDGKAWFHDSWFQSADFSQTVFLHKVDLSKDTISGRCNFSDTRFGSDVDLTESKFAVVHFSGSWFKQDVDASNTEFDYLLDLHGVHFSPEASLELESAKLPDIIDLSNTPALSIMVELSSNDFPDSSRYTDLTRRWHYLNLFRADIPHIAFEYLHFRLCFYDPMRKDPVLNHFTKDGDWIIDGKPYKADDLRTPEAARLFSNPYIRHYLKQIFPAAGFPDSVLIEFLDIGIREHHFPAALTRAEKLAMYAAVLKELGKRNLSISFPALQKEFIAYRAGTSP